LLPQPPPLPRELRTEEMTALLAAADDPALLAMLLLLSGISVEEAIALRGSDIDPASGRLRIEGASARAIALSEPLRKLFAGRPQSEDRLLRTGGVPATEDTIDAQILCAAYDARLQSPAEVDAKCLRHSFIAYLVRQDIRFSDLQRLVGALPAQAVAAYASLSSTASAVPRDAIDPVLPAIRQFTSS